MTRRDAASSFFGEENVPHQALTMGVGTILEARKIVLMAFGEHKAPIVQRAVEGEITDAVTASFLQKHPDTTFMLDQAAARDLTCSAGPGPSARSTGRPALIRRGGHLAEPEGRKGAAETVRRRLPRARALRAAARAWAGQVLWAGASSTR